MEEKPALDIGGRLRTVRKRAGLSLDALSRTSGVSKAMLSQIEKSKANPTVAVLYKVAGALNLELSALIDAPGPEKAFSLIRADEERYIFSSNERCAVRTLSPLSLEKDVEFYEITLHAQGVLESEPHFKGTEEFLAVSKGKVEVCSDQRNAVLRAGDSAHYAADVPHRIRNLGKSAAVVYLVVKYTT